jgi:hypothetical protein
MYGATRATRLIPTAATTSGIVTFIGRQSVLLPVSMPRSSPQRHLNDVPAGRADRDAERDLLLASCDGVGKQTIQADGDEENRDVQ